MIYILLVLIFAFATMYNMVKRTEVIYQIILKKAHIIALVITALLLFILCFFFLSYNIYHYLISIVFMLYTISGLIVRGFNKKGIYNINEITNLARFVKWSEIKAINIAYNEEDYIDVTFVTGLRSFEHRYKNEIEPILLKIKKELNV